MTTTTSVSAPDTQYTITVTVDSGDQGHTEVLRLTEDELRALQTQIAGVLPPRRSRWTGSTWTSS